MSKTETEEVLEENPDHQDTSRHFVDKEERAKKRRWKTAFIVVQDENGKVFVDNSVRHFSDKIERRAEIEDVLYMLQMSTYEFQQDQIMLRLKALLEKVTGSDGIHGNF
tara:strand:- start:258 stop:584 length:327 start_codon:yes stop_codon:yes gene_type:complete